MKFREVQSHNGFEVGDIIHIKRSVGGTVMVDTQQMIDKITIDDESGKDTIWCGKYSTSSTDVANKGKVQLMGRHQDFAKKLSISDELLDFFKNTRLKYKKKRENNENYYQSWLHSQSGRCVA